MSVRRIETSRQLWTRRTAVAAAPVVLVAIAILHPGAAVSQVDLNDGAVWLTNTAELKVGRYNAAVEELNAGLVAGSATFDVLQDGMDVLLVESRQIAVVDPASVSLGGQTAVPYGSDVSMAGGTTAVIRPNDGAVFAKPTQAVGTLDVVTGEPDLELGEGGAAVVARSGLVVAVEPDGTVHHLDVGADGSVDHEAGRVDGALSGPVEQITAVGDDVVVLARADPAHDLRQRRPRVVRRPAGAAAGRSELRRGAGVDHDGAAGGPARRRCAARARQRQLGRTGSTCTGRRLCACGVGLAGRELHGRVR